MSGIKCPYVFVLGLCIFLTQSQLLLAQEQAPAFEYDTIHITPDSMIVFKDSILVPIKDTIIIIDKDISYKIKKNRYQKSESMYDSLYYKTHNKKITREVYNFLISHRPEEDQSKIDGKHTIALNPFEKYKGLVIRSIRFVRVDLLDGSVDDTTLMASSGFARILNKAHIDTHKWVLKKFMVVKVGDTIIPGILADNERIIRDINAIEDVRILVVPDSVNSYAADLIVVTKDVSPIGATASVSSFDNFSASLWSDNFLGFAHELGGKLLYDAQFKNPWGYELYTKYSNLWGTFTDGTIEWLDAFDTKWLNINFTKNLLTPKTKYGGGLSVGWIRDKYELIYKDTLRTGTFETNYQDIWLARSFLMGGESSRNNIIVSGRFERKKFAARPYTSADSNQTFYNRNFYYAKVGYAHYNFYKANMIKSYGISEDIPYGLNTALTIAYMDSDYFPRTYLGGSFGIAKYFDKFGYIAGNIIAGGFYNDGQLTQGLFESNMLYYTPLIKINKYSTRSFLRFRYREAITRDVDKLINFSEMLPNLDQEGITGTATMTLNFEFVLFSPWYFYGFRFAPFAFADFGLISSNRFAFTKNRTFSIVGAGFRIRNESLAFKTIILSFGYIPNTAMGRGDNFYDFRMGDERLVPILGIDRPYILSRDLILPF